jgi:hypothetical protein
VSSGTSANARVPRSHSTAAGPPKSASTSVNQRFPSLLIHRADHAAQCRRTRWRNCQ